MSYEIHVQNACAVSRPVPPPHKFERWVTAALQSFRPQAEVTVRIMEREEITRLNSQYRGKNRATNVLSFGCELPEGVDSALLGDIAICAEVVIDEAREQQKDTEAHWAHLTIHGTLHLLGYDHQQPDQAQQMEGLETALLQQLDFADPYIKDGS